MELPHVDIETGEIYGAEEGTYKWFHEKGHLIFDKQMSEYNLLRETILKVWMFSVCLALLLNTFFAYVSLILWAIWFAMGVYEEYWCNMYADKMMEEEEFGHLKI